MIDEARLQMKPHNRDEPDMDRARGLVEQLCEVASLTLRDGFPAHEVSIHGQNAFPCWRRRERIQRNTEEVLYAVIHAWAAVGYPIKLLGEKEAIGGWSPGPIVVDWAPTGLHGWDQSADGMLRRLGGQFGSTDRGVSAAILARWSLAERELEDTFFFGFDLFGTDFVRASLMDSDLRQANLSGADLSGANLVSANLSGANLVSANLSGVDLSGAKLIGTTLSGADLSGVDLIGADLSGADLSGAKLIGANCSRVDIDSARLQSADLSQAVNLTQEQIGQAFGNLETKLPDGMAIAEDRLRD